MPVIAVCAVRTGAGKSQTTRYVAKLLREMGRKVVVVRHPMPYGVLKDQRCERFAKMEDMRRFNCTIEEMEEYELHIEEGNVLYAGCDYQMILKQAEKEADVIIWDGGNNDTSFFKPNLLICVADALRAGDEMDYYPGQTNARTCDLVVVNKVNSAEESKLVEVQRNMRSLNPTASITLADSIIEPSITNMSGSEPSAWIKGKKALVIDDGPTLTHGGMPFGAGYILAQRCGATVVDPKKFAKGLGVSAHRFAGVVKDIFARYHHLKHSIPALGYSPDIPADMKLCRARYFLQPKDDVIISAVKGMLQGARHRTSVEQKDSK